MQRTNFPKFFNNDFKMFSNPISDYERSIYFKKDGKIKKLNEVKIDFIRIALKDSNFNICGAAKKTGINRVTLTKIINKYKMDD